MASSGYRKPLCLIYPKVNTRWISFNDLKVEVHHREYFVTGRTITPLYISTEVITIIEEESAKVAKLEIGFRNLFSPDSELPENGTIAVKEPYLRYCGEGNYAIHVDHPSDIAILRRMILPFR
jgi:hypothetical protein